MASNSLREGLQLLRQPGVCKIFLAFLISHTGSAMAPIAMAFGVLELTNSPKDSAIVIAAPTLASILILLLGGALADRTSRKHMVVFADTLALIAQFTMGVLFLTHTASVLTLTLLMLINGIAIALNAPASSVLITQLVERDQLQAANALLGTARNGAIAGGAALGGALVAFFGAGITLVIDAISFGVSALLVIALRPKPQRRPDHTSFIQDLKLGWKEFTSHTWLWVIVAQFSLVVAATESVFGLLGPAVSKEHLAGASDWGYIAASFGLGSLTGALIAIKVKAKYPIRLATACVFTFSFLPISLAFPLPFYLIALTAFINGVGGQIFSVLWNTTMQQHVPAQMLSRIVSYDHLGSVALTPLGIVVAGFLFEFIGFRATLITAALAIILPTAIAFMVREVRMVGSG